ncbi:hypothetical protein J730_4174, partial [Acinetobacter baumannii 1042969-1197]
LFEVKKQNLRNKGYDENNAAVTKVEFSEAMARPFCITAVVSTTDCNQLNQSVFG